MRVGKTPPLGSLRDRVELRTNAQSIGDAGGVSDNFISRGFVWAHVQSTAGTLSQFLDNRNSKTSHNVVMRFRSDLSPGDRIMFRTQTLEIVSADDLNGRRAYLKCRCSEIEATG